MTNYIIRRCLMAVPLILVIILIVFVVLRIAVPGDPAQVLAGDRASPAMVEQIRHRMGLDKPVYMQFLIFVANLVRGDLGRSVFLNDPVSVEIAKAFPVTLTLALATMTFGTPLGLTIGIVSAIKKNSWIDTSAMGLTIFLYSMPTFWLGLMLMLILGVWLRILPVQGVESWKGFVMPVITLGVGQAAIIARLTRSSMIEVMSADYVRTARAKGLSEAVVLIRHALKNALIPVVTVIGLSIGALLGGAVVTETIFNLPGVGRLAIVAIFNRDYPMIQGSVLVVAISFVFVNLLVDIVYALVDPRIRYE